MFFARISLSYYFDKLTDFNGLMTNVKIWRYVTNFTYRLACNSNFKYFDFPALDGVMELHKNASRNNESTVLEPFVREDQITGYDATYVNI